ncbi:hypothetical protein HDU92_002309 [Lobulomyces angularis]|nr:hypothetical protein HDU92_002309 [Lobulomyces angularis]
MSIFKLGSDVLSYIIEYLSEYHHCSFQSFVLTSKKISNLATNKAWFYYIKNNNNSVQNIYKSLNYDKNLNYAQLFKEKLFLKNCLKNFTYKKVFEFNFVVLSFVLDSVQFQPPFLTDSFGFTYFENGYTTTEFRLLSDIKRTDTNFPTIIKKIESEMFYKLVYFSAESDVLVLGLTQINSDSIKEKKITSILETKKYAIVDYHQHPTEKSQIILTAEERMVLLNEFQMLNDHLIIYDFVNSTVTRSLNFGDFSFFSVWQRKLELGSDDLNIITSFNPETKDFLFWSFDTFQPLFIIGNYGFNYILYGQHLNKIKKNRFLDVDYSCRFSSVKQPISFSVATKDPDYLEKAKFLISDLRPLLEKSVKSSTSKAVNYKIDRFEVKKKNANEGGVNPNILMIKIDTLEKEIVETVPFFTEQVFVNILDSVDITGEYSFLLNPFLLVQPKDNEGLKIVNLSTGTYLRQNKDSDKQEEELRIFFEDNESFTLRKTNKREFLLYCGVPVGDVDDQEYRSALKKLILSGIFRSLQRHFYFITELGVYQLCLDSL